MMTRFDHAVIAVRDLDAAMQAYRALGFEVRPGGRHPGHGTANALIRFGLDYLELLTIADEGEARAQGLNGQSLAAFLERHGGGLVGYALASDDIAADAGRLRAAGLAVEGPFGMQRQRPDGTVLAWQLAIPGDTPWRNPLPFLIEWAALDSERLALEQPGAHANGLVGVVGVRVAVRDMDAALSLYQQGLGLSLRGYAHVGTLGALRARFDVGDVKVDILSPGSPEPMPRALASEGEGLYDVILVSRDIEATRRFFLAAGVGVTEATDVSGGLRVPAEAALGARLVIVPRA
jgi:catechol 2,3-dioxygenase-like lactoylglutathione lyase family enzyme